MKQPEDILQLLLASNDVDEISKLVTKACELNNFSLVLFLQQRLSKYEGSRKQWPDEAFSVEVALHIFSGKLKRDQFCNDDIIHAYLVVAGMIKDYAERVKARVAA